MSVSRWHHRLLRCLTWHPPFVFEGGRRGRPRGSAPSLGRSVRIPSIEEESVSCFILNLLRPPCKTHFELIQEALLDGEETAFGSTKLCLDGRKAKGANLVQAHTVSPTLDPLDGGLVAEFFGRHHITDHHTGSQRDASVAMDKHGAPLSDRFVDEPSGLREDSDQVLVLVEPGSV